ncbi:MAG: hypothetical protein R2824_25010 [Saprospiraceae bacterium]|nr:hypothetical protein [Lewinella sp.]
MDYEKTIMLLMAAFVLHCCSSKESTSIGSQTAVGYERTQLPYDTTQLWITPDSLIRELVIIDCPGGPDSILEFQSRDQQRYRYLPDYSRFSIVSLYQAQSFNSSLYQYARVFTPEDAAYEVAITSEMLHRAIAYFKSRGKKVYVVGSSYGAFVIQHYLANYESEADLYVVLSGRLDMDQPMVEENLQGNSGRFREDGRTYVPDEDPIAITDRDQDTREDLVCNRLKAAIGQARYTDLLAQKNLSNVIYIYAPNDEQVGSLREEEIAFLRQKGALVFADDRGHGKTWQRLIDEVGKGKIPGW